METATGLRHRLLAILAADGVAYSRLMSIDEPGTVATLDAARAIFRSEIEAESGRVIDMAGDSVLAVFETASAATRAALAVQARLSQIPAIGTAGERLRFRIGLHLGDVYEKDDGTVYGDGVNVAARLQTLAEPSGVAVSESIRSAVQGRSAASFEDIGEQAVKNIATPVRVYRMRQRSTSSAAASQGSPAVKMRRAGWTAAAAAAAVAMVALIVGWSARSTAPAPEADTSKALAVLPFANVSEDAGNDWLATGVSEELIGLLARVPGLRLVSRNSSFGIDGRTLPASEISKRLGVGFLVEGSVRRAGDRVRLAARLVRGADGSVLWSQTYDREYRDLLVAQTELALQIAAQLQMPLDRSSLAGSGTSNVEAWHLVLEGQHKPLEEREPFYRRALALDPKFVRAHLELANDAFEAGLASNTREQRQQARDRSMAHLETALKLDPRSAEAYGRMASAESLLDDTAAMRRDMQKALELNPNDAPGLFWSATLELENGRMEHAISYASRLVDADPLSSLSHWQQARILRWAGRPKAALAAAERSLALDPESRDTRYLRGAILMDLGRLDEAREVARQLNAVALSSALASAAELSDLDRRTDLNSHQRGWVDLALGRYAAFIAHADEHVGDLGWRADALFDPRLDPVRKLPAFTAWLERCGLQNAHERAQAWRKANPPSGG